MDFTPPNYAGTFAGNPSPLQSIGQGFGAGMQMQQVQLEQAQKQYAFQRMQQMQTAAAQVAQNPTTEGIAQLSIAFPEIGEQMRRSYDMQNPIQQRTQLSDMTQVYAAMHNDRPDIASQLLTNQADALENSGGNPQQIQHLRTMAQWATTDPNSFKMTSGLAVASILGPEKFGDTVNSLNAGEKQQALLPAEKQKAQAEADVASARAAFEPAVQQMNLKNVQSQVDQRANQLQLDRDKLMTETQTKLKELELQYGVPPPESTKIINESATSAAANEQSAARLNDLATRMEGIVSGARAAGKVSSVGETMNRVFGTEDGVTALKQEYGRIVNNQALSSIKDALGGRVTDVDMKTAMSTVPDANASPTVVSSYLRGVAKLTQLQAATDNAKAEWLAQVGHAGHLGPAPKDITIMGTQVPKGTSFADFSRQFIQQKAEQIQAQAAVANAQNRSYMRFATPQQTQPTAPPSFQAVPGTD